MPVNINLVATMQTNKEVIASFYLRISFLCPINENWNSVSQLHP